MTKQKRAVVALGGNALGNNLAEQRQAVKHTAHALADLIQDHYQVVVVHGNGPQVGMLKKAMETQEPQIPLPVCIAISQSYIGYDLQNAIRQELHQREITHVPVCTLVTQVKINPNDPAFLQPSKPIGRFMTKEEGEQLSKETGCTVKEDAGRGYRQVVPSPQPVEIVELPTISTLVDAGQLVIACGGGGVPVIEDGSCLKETDAVVDKDFISSLLAEKLDADLFVILTAVEHATLHFGTKDETPLHKITTHEARNFIKEGHFSAGSMLPKIEAATKFAESKKDRIAVITLLEQARNGIAGHTGTHIQQP